LGKKLPSEKGGVPIGVKGRAGAAESERNELKQNRVPDGKPSGSFQGE